MSLTVRVRLGLLLTVTLLVLMTVTARPARRTASVRPPCVNLLTDEWQLARQRVSALPW